MELFPFPCYWPQEAGTERVKEGNSRPNKSIKMESSTQKKITQEKSSAHVKLSNEMDQLKAKKLQHNRKLIDLEFRSRRNNLLFFVFKRYLNALYSGINHFALYCL